MDPCPFVRLIVESLSLKLPQPTKPGSASGIYPSATPCFCKISANSFPTQTALLPLSSGDDNSPPESSTSAPGFHFDPAALRRLAGRALVLRLSVYARRTGRTCGISAAKRLGRVHVTVVLDGAHSRPVVFQSGWMKLAVKGPSDRGATVHLVIRSEPEPRFVFQFGGEPECSPVVYQIQENNNVRQPVFSCKFTADRNSRSRPLPSDTLGRGGWVRRLLGNGKKLGKERKGWMVIIYDLSGSAVAAASMIMPFVPSPGTDRVSRSNPGAWLILRPYGGHSVSTWIWKPWGRLEAWHERGSVDGLGYKFELVNGKGPTDSWTPITKGTMGVKKGGSFCIDGRTTNFCGGLGLRSHVKGFVMSSTVEGEGKPSRPLVQIGARYVTCTADAALFIALSAAIDLSMDACMLFSKKLRKELCCDY
ncbi:hypothetical protein SAY87_017322 [Trapa incisa]|uniref:Uncharacterized protein n=1 Tax=Trapa incisa TaxID=236973 RepID=A0AAN7QYD0_9MYRT|nr:hypothetical protein SAY87_017322 [Trapa incisa]